MKVPPRKPQRREAVAWWIKCDPTSDRHRGWNWPDLFNEYTQAAPYLWSVGPFLSQRNARMALRGDPVFGYAAGEGYRALVALAEVERGGVFVAGEGPATGASPFPGGFTVAIRPVSLLEKPIPLPLLRQVMRGLEPEFFRTRFGSIFKVRAREMGRLLQAVESANPRVRIPRAWRTPRQAPTRPARGRG